jgi:hypothetical protein
MTVLAMVAAIVAPTPAPAVSGRECMEKPDCRERVVRKHWRKTVRPFNAKLDRMNQCEASGNWDTNTGNGFFGGLQFDLPTWRWVGGSGLPSAASELEQKFRAVLLIGRAGYGPWPRCGSA